MCNEICRKLIILELSFKLKIFIFILPYTIHPVAYIEIFDATFKSNATGKTILRLTVYIFQLMARDMKVYYRGLKNLSLLEKNIK